MRDTFKICATCAHLRVIDEGQEFPGIVDTAYVVFECRLLGQRIREDYLMKGGIPQPHEPSDLPVEPAPTCPHWSSATTSPN